MRCKISYAKKKKGKKKTNSLFTPELLKFPFLRDSFRHSSEVFVSIVSRLDFS